MFIDFFAQTKGRYEHLLPIARAAENGELVIVASTTVLAEVLGVDRNRSEEAVDNVRRYLQRDEILLRAADWAVCARVQELRGSLDETLQAMDALHVATAIETDCDALLTNDGDGLRRSRSKRAQLALLALDKRLATRHGPLRVLTPRAWNEARESGMHPLTAGVPPA